MTRDDYIEPDPRDTEAEAIEREDAADQAIVDRQRETLDDPALRGDWLYPGEYPASRHEPASVLALHHALDRTQQALGLPTGHLSPAIIEAAIKRDHALAQAVTAWREVDRYASRDSRDGRDALTRLADAADRYVGLGIGQDWRTGGDAA